MYSKASARLEMAQKNIEAFTGIADDIKTYTRKEFKKYEKSLSDSIGVKRVAEVHKFYITNNHKDTTIVEFNPIIEKGKIDSSKNSFSEIIGCFEVGGVVDWNNKQLKITGIDYETKVVVAEYLGKREKKLLFFRYGKRERKLTCKSACGDSLKIEKINVVRN
jgi:hypothetical protein